MKWIEDMAQFRKGERGPDKKLHVPRYSSGCYYDNLESCCWLCMGRISLQTIHRIIQSDSDQPTGDHILVGKELIVPDIHHLEDDNHIDHEKGEVTKVFKLNDQLNVVGIQLESGEEIALLVKKII